MKIEQTKKQDTKFDIEYYSENLRIEISQSLNKKIQSNLGQYFTPFSIAKFMASLFSLDNRKNINCLDAGAGVGLLTNALLNRLNNKSIIPSVTLYELDSEVVVGLEDNLKYLKEHYNFIHEVVNDDFIVNSSLAILEDRNTVYDLVILNPPYKKMKSDSIHRKWLKLLGVDTVNLYTAFISLSIKQLSHNGELIAIIPRSFCNGTYFRTFRRYLLDSCKVNQIHSFKSRKETFSDNDILQENVIIHVTKGGNQEDVIISESSDGTFSDLISNRVPFNEVVKNDNDEKFIFIPNDTTNIDTTIIESLPNSLKDLPCSVSTGPVVSHRMKEHLLKDFEPRSIPLIYSSHFSQEGVNFPIKDFKKHNAIVNNEKTLKSFYKVGYYVILKRMSSKEEAKRIVARVMTPENMKSEFVAFTNGLNVYHSEKGGLDPDFAFGLCCYLNSSVLDRYFRTFSGHTQVNATDLRNIRYPSEVVLNSLGAWWTSTKDHSQEAIDNVLIEKLCVK